MKRLLNFLFRVGAVGALWKLANAALTLANIPTPANASVQVGATAITDAVVSVAATGGEYTTRDIKTLNNTYSVAGGRTTKLPCRFFTQTAKPPTCGIPSMRSWGLLPRSLGHQRRLASPSPAPSLPAPLPACRWMMTSCLSSRFAAASARLNHRRFACKHL